MNLPLVFIIKWHFDIFQDRPPGEPREHHLGEILQGMSKSKCFGSGFHNPNYLERKKILFQTPGFYAMFQNISIRNSQTSWSSSSKFINIIRRKVNSGIFSFRTLYYSISFSTCIASICLNIYNILNVPNAFVSHKKLLR